GLLVGNSVLSKRSAAGPPDQAIASPTAADTTPRTAPEAVARVAQTGRANPQVDPTAAQQLIGQLTGLKVEGGKLTEEQAAQIQQNLQQLIGQGSVAIPVIRDFLERNQDTRFGKWPIGTTGAPSVRTGLLDALNQIGGPEAVALSQHVLHTTADPME